MTLKIVKGGNKIKTDSGTYIIQAINIKDEIGYIADVNNKISVSKKLIPQVVRYTSYKEAKRQLNHIESNIQGLKLKILGEKHIAEILEDQDNLDIVVPVNEVNNSYIVSVFDKDTKEIIGYITFNPDNNTYMIKKDRGGVAFWEGKENVERFIEGAKQLIKSYPNLELISQSL
jgi:hypothetical protein